MYCKAKMAFTKSFLVYPEVKRKFNEVLHFLPRKSTYWIICKDSWLPWRLGFSCPLRTRKSEMKGLIVNVGGLYH